MLRSLASSRRRAAGVASLPNRRSNTRRGLFSWGSGVVGVSHEVELRYTQL